MALLAENLELLAKEGVVVGTTSGITKDDALIVVDMQVDFLPGGAFGVAEGDQTVKPIVDFIGQAAAVGARIFATRDYHPVDHCSFNSHGGPFPPHCVQNSRGSQFDDAIAAALQPLVKTGAATIVFKGFSPDVDSFGAFSYADGEIGSRVSCNAGGSHCGSTWTGAFGLFSSTIREDINAPPDVMAVLSRVALKDLIGKPKRIFVVGLAFDFCVLDTAVNAATVEGAEVHVLADLARSAHIPGFGKFGTGFLSDPASVAAKIKGAKIAASRI